jgi:catechol O-methyltransferase
VNLKRRVPFLRWSVWRLALGGRTFMKTGQFGDGREAAAADYVESHARRGDIDDVLAAIDTFAYEKSMLINVGDEKGALLDAAVRRADPRLALELGTYCGYSALRIARAAPAAKVFSVEFAAANAEIARRTLDARRCGRPRHLCGRDDRRRRQNARCAGHRARLQ